MENNAFYVKKEFSFKKRIYRIMYLLMGVEIVCLLGFMIYTSLAVRRQRFRDVRQTLALYDNQISQSLLGVDYYLMEIASYSSEYSRAAVQTKDDRDYTGNARLRNLMEYNLRSFQVVEGMFTYFPLSDTWISVQNYESTRQIFHNHLRELITDQKQRIRMGVGSGVYWRTLEYDGTTYLVRIFNNRNSYAGAWTNLDRLSESLTDLGEFQALVLFSDKAGQIFPMRKSPLPEDMSSQETEQLSETLVRTEEEENYQIARIAGERHLVALQHLGFSDEDIHTAALVPVRAIDISLKRYAQITLVILAVTLGAFVMIVRGLRRFLKGTVAMLSSVTDAVASGHGDERINTTEIPLIEMRQIGTSFNHMVDRVQSFKIQAYEESLQAKNFQLLALRSQVAPHFLINCLNMIGYLNDGTEENTRIIQQMIGTLSKHLRYTLSTRERVTLSEEAEYERNYVALSELRFPGCITFDMEISDEASKAMVFPLILIMFTENTFKYNLVMREQLKLTVRAEVYEKDGERRLHLTHIDSGGGYPDDVLEMVNRNASSGIADSGGKKIGLRNISRRLQLYYGESAVLKLSNEPGMGARNDIDIPYVEYVDGQ